MDDKLSGFLEQLVQATIDFLKANGYDDVDEVAFKADGLKTSVEFGRWTPDTDAYVGLYDENNKLIDEYL